MPLSAQQIADKWAARAGQAQGAYKDGINSVTTAPGQLAANNQAAMLANFNQAVTSGLWARRVAGITLEGWKQSALVKGAANYATGVAAGKPKMVAAMQYYGPVAQQVRQAVQSIPRDGGAGSMQRVQIAMQMFQAAKAARGG